MFPTHVRNSSSSNILRHEFSVKAKMVVFSLISSIGIGCIGTGIGIGSIDYSQASNQMSQVNAITTMAAGSVTGLVLLIIGIIGGVKNYLQHMRQEKEKKEIHAVLAANEHVAENSIALISMAAVRKVNEQIVDQAFKELEGIVQVNSDAAKGLEVTFVNPYNNLNACEGLIFGPDEWLECGVSIIGKVLNCPKVNWGALDPFFRQPFGVNYCLFYYPKKISIKNKTFTPNFTNFKKMYPQQIKYCPTSITMKFGDSNDCGWTLISKSAIPDSFGKPYLSLLRLLEERNFSVPSLSEIVGTNLMINALSDEIVLGENIYTYTDAREGNECVVVGDYSERNPIITGENFPEDFYHNINPLRNAGMYIDYFDFKKNTGYTPTPNNSNIGAFCVFRYEHES